MFYFEFKKKKTAKKKKKKEAPNKFGCLQLN